ncbi:hypothetical protein ACYIU4_002827 [Clostridium botulinum]
MDASFKYKIEGNSIEQDLINNTQGKTVWQKIYLYLKKLGYKVYSVGQKRDKCTNGYIVLKENGTHALDSNVNGYKLFDVIIYYPQDKYSSMEFYVEDVKKVLKDKEITQFLRATGNETSVILDGEVEGYTTSIEYQQFKKL